MAVHSINEAGNMILFIFLAFLVLALIPPLVMMVFPAADIIIRIILVFLIFTTVRGYMGGGLLSLIISGVLIYFLVIKWAYFTASMYVFFYFIMTFAITSVVIWGVGMNLRKG
ncbi:MAG: hypothetical protein JW744_01830 [Candidatus Diapherotrites archaeon]|uniref:Uncharacterized protein n=1 Tax=Candidatus Iainarchaeum sp. TaxID=3101447 RepID=A0A938YWM0_9ARCH|nr:hypothetical protein [Candidatus Diapherotrites archaeon]